MKSYRNEKNGSIIFGGKKIVLTQQAYYDKGGYAARGIDEEGNEYRVTWETTKEWDENTKDYNTAMILAAMILGNAYINNEELSGEEKEEETRLL